MPTLRRATNEAELKKLVSLFLKAETAIINEIGRLRSQGYADYHAVACLERVQAILRQMESDSWEWAPKVIEKQFYVAHPEARRIEGETTVKHLRGYLNAGTLTAEQHAIIDQLVANLMGEITDAALTAYATVESALIGRVEPDVFRRVGLEQVALQQARGVGTYKALPDFVDALRKEGITAFVDKAGRHWSLHTYGSMVSRTTSRQAEVLSVLTADPEQDLYRISVNSTTCGICAPYEGRVYSKSGTNPEYPPLAAAFGKRDPDGPDTLANTWLNLHPRCQHGIAPWSPIGRSDKEIQEIRDFSSFEKNPPSVDPRTEKQIKAYRAKEKARAQWLREYRQWERYRMTVGDPIPKTFTTFQKHKAADDDKYKRWEKLYREANKEADNGKE